MSKFPPATFIVKKCPIFSYLRKKYYGVSTDRDSIFNAILDTSILLKDDPRRSHCSHKLKYSALGSNEKHLSFFGCDNMSHAPFSPPAPFTLGESGSSVTGSWVWARELYTRTNPQKTAGTSLKTLDATKVILSKFTAILLAVVNSYTVFSSWCFKEERG